MSLTKGQPPLVMDTVGRQLNSSGLVAAPPAPGPFVPHVKETTQIMKNTSSLHVNVDNDNREYTLLAAFEQFQLGWDYYMAHEPIKVCKNVQQRRGWFAANSAEAAANLPANCADRLGF